MQLLTCAIAIAGDDHSIVRREHETAVTFPELLILKALHGGESVRDIADAGDVSRDPDEERTRLRSIYGHAIVMQVFPGDHTPLPEFDQRMRRAQKAQEDPPEELRDEPRNETPPTNRRK